LENQEQDFEIINLSAILNVLWRRRKMIAILTLVGLIAGIGYGIITKPLYKATAQIRPGITSFTPDGGPVRDWLIKDIVHWYKNGIYGPELKKELGIPEDVLMPIITANFIPRAIGVQGGNVITLNNLSESPEEAVAILESSINVFTQQANSDSTSNVIVLTIRGIDARIDGLQRDIDDLVIKKQKYDIDIAQAERELWAIEIAEKRFVLKMAETEALGVLREDGISYLEKDIETASQLIGDMDNLLSGFDNSQDSVVVNDRLAENNELLAGLFSSTVIAQDGIKNSSMLVDKLRYQKSMVAIATDDLLLQKQLDIDNRKILKQQAIDRLIIKRDKNLKNDRLRLSNQIKSLRDKKEMLSPIEKVGSITSTVKPVRPRKERAAMLLTFAALFGSVVLAFVLEYYSKHKDEILASE
jgi:LPS O-antigen subunit length determinant protein (WzzB/FepE family)